MPKFLCMGVAVVVVVVLHYISFFLAAPGRSCRDNEICTGGSICTLPIALCLCPGELEEKNGECVLPATASIVKGLPLRRFSSEMGFLHLYILFVVRVTMTEAQHLALTTVCSSGEFIELAQWLH